MKAGKGRAKMKLFRLWAALAGMILAGLGLQASAQQQPHEEAILLVASPGLRDADYRQAVVLAVPIDNDRHLGVIINRPTRRSLASLFPEHQPSKKVAEPVFFGGPMSRGAVVAVVRTQKDPGRGAIGLTHEMYLAMTVNVVDRIIEESPNDARYYVGYIVWRPGELRAEIDRKVWSVSNVNPEVVFRKDTTSLWEELSRLSRAITASIALPCEPSLPSLRDPGLACGFLEGPLPVLQPGDQALPAQLVQFHRQGAAVVRGSHLHELSEEPGT
jgi:putative transcriptional regulator